MQVVTKSAWERIADIRIFIVFTRTWHLPTLIRNYTLGISLNRSSVPLQQGLSRQSALSMPVFLPVASEEYFARFFIVSAA